MRYRVIAGTVVLGWFCIVAYGTNPKALEVQADLIVIGESKSITLSWPETLLSVTVEQVIKGDTAPGNVLPVHMAYPYARDIGQRQISETHRGIWFLKREGPDIFRCIAAQGPSTAIIHAYYPMAISAAPELQATAGESVHDVITRLVAGTLEDSLGNSELFLSVASDSSSSTVMGILHYLSASKESRKRATGIAGLIGRNDKQAVLSFVADRKAFSEREINMVAATLSDFRSSDTDTVSALGNLLTDPSSSAFLREAAAKSLRAVHTRETLPYMAVLLDSPDLARQVDGVFGLSGFANGFDVQTAENVASMGWLINRKPTAFTTPETTGHMLLLMNADAVTRQEVVNFWKDWWARNKATLGFN